MGKKLTTLERLQNHASTEGGRCLSRKYLGYHVKHEFRCRKGHKWEATPAKILSGGRWCPTCAGKEKLSIDVAKKIAKERNGQCLSKKYVRAISNLRWKCNVCGHEWSANLNNVKRGSWCPVCQRRKAGLKRRLGIESMKEIAKSRGGECLSKRYVNATTNIRWICKDGHEWESTPSKIKQGHWCPECQSHLGERFCRIVFQSIFKKRFPRQKPKWLCSSSGTRMELDGYCRSLGLAFEHQGRQHYEHVSFFHTKSAYRKRRKYDKEKRKLCRENGVVLIEIPSVFTILGVENLKDFVTKECMKHGFKIAKKRIDKLEIDYSKIYIPDFDERKKNLESICRKWGGKLLSKKYLGSGTKLRFRCSKGHIWETAPEKIMGGRWCSECRRQERSKARVKKAFAELRNIATKRGGSLLSKTYKNSDTALRWQCKCGNVWSATPTKVKIGQWCPICRKKEAGQARRTPIMVWQRLAKQRGGRCLSRTYDESNKKLRWKCSKGHEWEAVPISIKSGTWCPYCAGRHRTIEYCRNLAKKRGGRCLSKKYLGADKKHKWRCKNGHTWEATPNHVKQGTWCPDCAGTRKSDIKEMKRIARARGGRCLSSDYINANSKLTWKCAKGHVWDATPANIKYGKWCPDCSGTKRLTIEEMHKIAAKKGGKCLSKKYVNAITKLKWQCDKGHTWEARPANIKSGRWCPRCAVKVRGNWKRNKK